MCSIACVSFISPLFDLTVPKKSNGLTIQWLNSISTSSPNESKSFSVGYNSINTYTAFAILDNYESNNGCMAEIKKIDGSHYKVRARVTAGGEDTFTRTAMIIAIGY